MVTYYTTVVIPNILRTCLCRLTISMSTNLKTKCLVKYNLKLKADSASKTELPPTASKHCVAYKKGY